jgi:glycosyltransferase involved in cell wall biosynthesis
MKNLHIIPSMNPAAGGPVEGLKQLAKALLPLDVSVEIACCDAPDAPWLKDSALPVVHALGPARGGYAYAPRLLPWLKQRAATYDAVVVEGIWQYHSFAAWRALAGLSTPYFVFTHGMLDPWFKHAYPLKHLKKWLYWPWADYRTLRDARAVLFTCEEEKLLAPQSFCLYRAHPRVATYGTSPPPANKEELVRQFFESWPQLRGKRIVLFLSRLHPKKGCDLLIKAFAKEAKVDPSLHLLFVGPGQDDFVASLKDLAVQGGIEDRVTWAGMLGGDAKWGAYYASEVFMLPSHQENFGVVVAEALACGLPVLISDKVNIWREIADARAGFVEKDTQEGASSLLRRWFALSAQEREEMAVRAAQCFLSHFHIARAAEVLAKILREESGCQNGRHKS